MPVLPGAEPFTHDGGDVGVLLCHGFTGTPQSLRPWALRLAAEGHAVRVPLLPGHGTTWRDLNATRWADWYAAVTSAFDELRGRCRIVVVGGLSMGGAMAARLAAERGPQVAGLVVVNPAFVSDDARLRALPLMQHLVASFPGISSDIAKPGARELAYDRTPLKALRSFTATWDATIRVLPRVTQPLLLLRSRVDHVVPARSSAVLLSSVSSRDVTEVVLERSLHVATLDHDADQIETQTVAFIRRLVGVLPAARSVTLPAADPVTG